MRALELQVILWMTFTLKSSVCNTIVEEMNKVGKGKYKHESSQFIRVPGAADFPLSSFTVCLDSSIYFFTHCTLSASITVFSHHFR